MRHRSAWFRTLASMLALWLPLVAGEPGLLQPCAMHGAGRLVAASLVRHSVAHEHHAAVHGADKSGTKHEGHQCSCIDGCTVSATTFVAPAAPAVEIAVAEGAATRSVPTVESLARPAPAFSRPYTTGPPRA